MKRAFLIVVLALMTLPGLFSFQGQNINSRGRMQSLFLYNFASKYIEWPTSYKEGNFIIGILGDTPVLNELGVVTSAKKIFNQSIEIKKFNTSTEISKCNMLFVPHDKAEALQEVVGKLKNSSTLIITEKDGVLKQGAIINFISVDGKLKFETNKTEIEKREIRIAADLLKLSVNTI